MLEFNPAVDFKLLLAVPLIPLVGYVLQIFLGKRLPHGDKILTGGMFVVMCISLLMAAKSIWAAYHGVEFVWNSADHAEHGMVFNWIHSEGVSAENVVASIFLDPLGAAMLAVVGVVSFFVHLFSTGYMHGDRRYHIFFANISLFTFAMLGVVLADNILFFFIFWELMGLMSYLLIGHFGHDPTSARITHAASACKKAFLTTRVGDVCLFIGILIFYNKLDTLSFTGLWSGARDAVAANGGEYPAWMTGAGLLVFGGTVGKSAQFPLHIWLPDAMEGPTPVSAMIHAATMVAAGVFLLGRTYPLLSPDALAVIATVGTITAVFAATIGMTVHDIKGVLAYSTISQLGFMVAAVGCGGVVAGMFHMVTHAFFKSCLFLSAGSVIHGCHHNQDMRWMGGLRKVMPLTFAAMLISTLAIAGVPFFSGFYSKDMILMSAFEANATSFSGATLFASIGLPLAAALTAFYMFRLIFLTFFGEYRGHLMPQHAVHHGDEPGDPDHDHDHGHSHESHEGHEGHGSHAPHESPRPMTVALLCLALLGFLGGNFWLAAPFGSGDWFNESVSLERLYGEDVVAGIPHLHAQAQALHAEHAIHAAHGGPLPADLSQAAIEAGHRKASAHSLALYVSLFVASLGILCAFLIYYLRIWDPARITAALGMGYTTVRDKYYVDEAVNATVIRGTMALSKGQTLFDRYVVDALVNLVGRVNRWLGFFAAAIDTRIVDGLVNWIATSTQAFGAIFRLFQTGRIQQYAAFAVAGGLLLSAWLILS